MGRDMGLWNNQKGMVTNISVITQWDTVPSHIPASDGKAQAKEFGKSLPEMGKAVMWGVVCKNRYVWMGKRYAG